MLAQHISAKLFFAPPFPDADEFIPLFHRWIQEDAVPGLLIDVVDYRHVHHGPGIILAGFEGSYALDFDQGRPGLRYSRNPRGWQDDPTQTDAERLKQRLVALLETLFHAAALVETSEMLSQPPSVLRNEMAFTFLDRLQTPNTDATARALSPILEEALQSFMPDAQLHIQRQSIFPGDPLTFSVTLTSTP